MDRLIRKILLLDSGTIENLTNFKYRKIIGAVYLEVLHLPGPCPTKSGDLL